MIAQTSLCYKFGRVTYDLRSRTHLMGILNVTPDSFSDGGAFPNVDAAVRRGLEMAREGADFIDVGGESTRPGAHPVPVQEELRRVVPVIRQLSESCQVPISIDTRKSQVAEQALDAGATLVNDISGLHFDERMLSVVADSHATVVLMHMKGTPQTMQLDPRYVDLFGEVIAYLEEGIGRARAAGIEQIFVDPGIGFGKTAQDNLNLLKNLHLLQQLELPILIGPSRKSFIGSVLDLPVEERVEGTAAAVAAGILNGAHVVRIHDVKAMKRVAQIVDAISGSTEGSA